MILALPKPFPYTHNSDAFANHSQSTKMLIFLVSQCLTGLVPSCLAFDIIWNAPSDRCESQWNQTIDLQSHGIKGNERQKFYGNEIVLFYTHALGTYPHVDNTGRHKHGGIPQLVNLTNHISRMTIDINRAMPNINYNGLAVIDWESWWPLWEANWGRKRVYRDLSIALARTKHRRITNETLLRIVAEGEFNRAAKLFMLQTLQHAKSMRPNAKWGFYYYPFCSREPASTGHCDATYMRLNDKLKWLFNECTALYPSAYLKRSHQKRPQTERHAYVQARLRETQRFTSIGHRTTPIYLYITYAYNLYEQTLDFYEKADLCSSIKQSADSGIDGVVLWGSWASVSDRTRCEQISTYVSDMLGPYAKLVIDMAEKCAVVQCHSHGRCRKFYGPQCQTISPLWYYVCECDTDHIGPTCQDTVYEYLAKYVEHADVEL